MAKRSGRVRDLAEDVPARFGGKAGIGHTRWATHGPATDHNAHPHTDVAGRVAVVHNGILDNASSLRARLTDEGVELTSDTDTEVLAHLVARSGAETLEGRVADALSAVEGTYGLAVVHADFPDRIVVARNGSPLIVGVGDKEMHVASDLAALVRYTTTVAYLDDGEMATVTAQGFTTYRHDTAQLHRTHRDAAACRRRPGGLRDRRARVVHARRDARAAARGRAGAARPARRALRHLPPRRAQPRRPRAARHPAGQDPGLRLGLLRRRRWAPRSIEELARIPADAEAASEFRYRDPVIEPDTLYVAVSQSGETIDTLLAVQEIRRKGGRVVGLVNVVGSAIARECDGGIYLHAGPEVAVASTKALTTMFLASRCSRCSWAGCATCRSPTASG